MATRRPSGRGLATPMGAVTAMVGASLIFPASLVAQLTPIEPLPVLADLEPMVEVGVSAHRDQPASLRNDRGRLVEFGLYRLLVPVGPVVLEMSGAALRRYEPEPGEPGATEVASTGEHRISTAVRIMGEGASEPAILLRFGAKLPTGDDETGLATDQTDLFATAAWSGRYGPTAAWVEAGIGILGTRDPRREQVDPLLYAAGLRWANGDRTVSAGIVGRLDTRRGPTFPGIDDQGELRIGLATGRKPRVRVELRRGWAAGSPALGLAVTVGSIVRL